MSHIESSRMPHAYAPVDEQDASLRETVSDAAKRAGQAVQSVPPLGWVLGLVGAGAVGAGIYATFFRDASSSRSSTRRRTPQQRRKPRTAAATGARKPRAKAAASQ
jgi:hypothetical protein